MGFCFRSAPGAHPRAQALDGARWGAHPGRMDSRGFLILIVGGLLLGVGVATWLVLGAPSPPPRPTARAPVTDWAAPLRATRAPLPTPRPGDWLTEHHEPGQSIDRYRASAPVRPSATLTTLYVLPIGAFSAAERVVLEETVAFMGAFFCLPTRILPARSAETIPAEARRPGVGEGEQFHVEYLLEKVLLPSRPPDAVAYLALTATDLWPGEGWNFVYGMAVPEARLGVWSFRRNGDLATERTLFVERTFKIAVHETAHILGMAHCTAWACVMNGVNHREEADRAPMTLCPEDLVKLAWNTGCEPKGRLARLAALTERLGLPARAAEYRAMLGQLGPPEPLDPLDQRPQQ